MVVKCLYTAYISVQSVPTIILMNINKTSLTFKYITFVLKHQNLNQNGAFSVQVCCLNTIFWSSYLNDKHRLKILVKGFKKNIKLWIIQNKS